MKQNNLFKAWEKYEAKHREHLTELELLKEAIAELKKEEQNG